MNWRKCYNGLWTHIFARSDGLYSSSNILMDLFLTSSVGGNALQVTRVT